MNPNRSVAFKAFLSEAMICILVKIYQTSKLIFIGWILGRIFGVL